METEYNEPHVMNYYRAPIGKVNCASLFFDANEQIPCELLRQYVSVYSLFSIPVSTLQMRIPFSAVLSRSFGLNNAECIYEAFIKDTSQRTGLFLLQQDSVQKAFQLLPEYAYSIAFFAGTIDADRLLNSLREDFLFVLSNPPALLNAAVSANAVLIHCINGWDGYSLNFITAENFYKRQSGDG